MSNGSSKPKYGPTSAIAVTVGSYFVSYFVFFILAGIGFGIYTKINGGSVADLANKFSDKLIGQFLTSFVIYMLLGGIVYLFMHRKKITLKHVGLGRWMNLSDAGLAIVAFVVYFVTLTIIMAMVAAFVPSVNLDQQQQLDFNKSTHGLGLVPIFIALAILPPLVEEFVMRGFLFTGLRNKFKFLPAALITSFIFSIAHLQLGAGAPPLYVASIDTFVLSMFLVSLREKTGSIWAGVFVHAIKNSLAFAALFIFKAS